MKELPKISIITVSYNSEQTIEKTINSVIAQNYGSLEYIIIDGLSQDQTQNIVKRYEDKLAYWVSEKDHGISDAFNKGLQKATGDIIGIINSDDFYATEAFYTIAKVFETNSDIGFVFGDQLFVDSQGIPLFLQAGNAEYLKTICHEMPSIPHPTVFVRREVYEQWGGFDENYKTAMDYEFLLRITKRGVKGEYIPATLACMSLGGESDRNYIRGYHEGMRISIQYGYDPFLAQMRFYYKCTKTSIKKSFEKVGLDHVVKIYRMLFSRRYLYNKS